MKIKLLNDGNHGDMGRVKFPVEVEAELELALLNSQNYIAMVSGEELERVGGEKFSGQSWTFYEDEFEVVK